MKEKLLESAKTIKDYCANEGVYHEEECPFFLGYDNDNNNAQCKIIRCVVWCCCKGIILEFGKMMGMGAFVWFWMIVSFYGAFFAKTGFECT